MIRCTGEFCPHLSTNLSSFLKNHSSSAALLKMTEDWRDCLDNREAVAAVAVDLSKAFDSICHNLLLAKLQAYGLSQPALDLISSYLLGRKQRVKLQGTYSSYRAVKAGVPQGSLLGPLLFNIFINDLNFCAPNISLRLYADDTIGYASDVSPAVLEFIINTDLQLLPTWFILNYLAVSNPKTQAFRVGPCGYDYDLNLNGSEIEICDSIKILRVTLDSKLYFREHITEQLKKAYSKATALRSICRFIPIDVMITLYKAFILPHLEYRSPLFVGIGKVQSNRIDNTNYYILRTLLGHAKTVPYEQLLKTVGLLNLRDRRIRQSLILLYKCLYCSGP